MTFLIQAEFAVHSTDDNLTDAELNVLETAIELYFSRVQRELADAYPEISVDLEF